MQKFLSSIKEKIIHFLKQDDLTKGSILKALIFLSFPLISTNILQTAYNLTDTFWVGRLGSKAVAAVSLSFPVIFIMISLGVGLPVAGAILTAHEKGAKNHKKINHIATQTLVSILIISILLSAIGYIFTPYLIDFMGIEPAVYQDTVAYLKISFLGLVPLFIFSVFQSLMRSIGEVKLPFLIVLSTVLLNLVLDPLFIFGYKDIIPPNGVKGAAIASVGTQTLAMLIGIYYLIKGTKGIQINLSEYKPDKKIIIKMFILGLPVSIEQISRSTGIFVMIWLVAKFGTLALASYGIGSRVLSFIIIPAFGLGMATSTLIGQNIGANKPDRIKKTVKLSLLIAFGVMFFLGIIFFFFAQDIAKVFIPNEPETIAESAYFIKNIAVSFGFLGVLIVLVGAFRGAGKTLTSMLLTIFSVWIFRFPLAYLLSQFTNLKVNGIWLSYPATNIATALIGLYILYKNDWLVHAKINTNQSSRALAMQEFLLSIKEKIIHFVKRNFNNRSV